MKRVISENRASCIDNIHTSTVSHIHAAAAAAAADDDDVDVVSVFVRSK